MAALEGHFGVATNFHMSVQVEFAKSKRIDKLRELSMQQSSSLKRK